MESFQLHTHTCIDIANTMKPFLSSATTKTLSQRRSFLSSFQRTSSSTTTNNIIQPNPSYVNLSHAPTSYLTSSSAPAVVYNSFLSKSECNALVLDITSKMKRRRYEKGHWDAVITTYKEVELRIPHDFHGTEEERIVSSCDLSKETIQTIQRVRHHLELHHFFNSASPDDKVGWLPSHAIDLAKHGELTAHVDSVKFSGGIVAGLSLLSSSIMRLRPEKEKKEEEGYIDLWLEQGSLYVLSGVARYEYTHELLPSGSIFTKLGGMEEEEIQVERDRRLSVIFRDAKF
uniref:Alpha-ketoglutarate-dependent dioxygenase AlkB-like domain-containing protein n=1 Tax=Ditylum brightwellii TaxID=49249 RepID=A0A7S4SMI8_9STRA|mmetsp:Transcript_13522/g.18141  ORF Transcript_13522/g.18141 Transcript_13522/m.18141 type:complete len:288 (+) Transcript_13522:128-991(+)